MPETSPVWHNPVPAALAKLIKTIESQPPPEIIGYYFSLVRPGPESTDTVSYGLLHRTKQGQLLGSKRELIVGFKPEFLCDEDIDPRNSNVGGTAADVMADISHYLEQGFRLVNQFGYLEREKSHPELHRGAIYVPLVPPE